MWPHSSSYHRVVAWRSVILEVADHIRRSALFQKPTLGSDLLEKYPLWCRGWGLLSGALTQTASLSVWPYHSIFSAAEVHSLLSHPVSSHQVLCPPKKKKKNLVWQGFGRGPTASSDRTGKWKSIWTASVFTNILALNYMQKATFSSLYIILCHH